MNLSICKCEDKKIMSDDTSPQEARFNALYAEYRRELLTFLMSRIQDREEAQDLLQVIWLRLWRNLDTVRGNPRGYLFTTAYHLIIDYHRHKQRILLLPLEWENEDGEILAYSLIEPSEAAEDKVVREEAISAAMASLSERLRCVIPYVVSGYSTKETGKYLGLPAGTIKTRSHHARKALKASCDERLAVY
jgi:RNA polymerase sigma-70 factor, ECF subfamily